MPRQYDFVTWEEDGVWTSHAPAIPGAYGIGDTATKAEKDLGEALDLLFDYLASVGETPPRSRKFRVGQVRV